MKKELNDSVLDKLFLGLQNDNCQFRRFATSDDMWEYPMKLIKEIEEQIYDNVNIVYKIIAKEKREKTQYTKINYRAIYEYQTILARVYCLLYYKYSEDAFYTKCVLAPLLKEMGIYADSWYSGIKNKLDEIHEKEKEIEEERMNHEKESYSKSDVDNIVNNYESKLNEKEETINQLTAEKATLEKKIEEIIGEEEEEEEEETENETEASLSDEEIAELKQKIIIETALQLFDLANDKYDYSIRGNKNKVAKLISCITSIPLQTIVNYLSNRWKKKAIPKPYRYQLENGKQIFETTGLKWKKLERRGY